MKLHSPTALIICEGFGYTTETHNNALAQANTPFLDSLCEKYPATLLKAHGNALGYPDYYGVSPYAGFWTLLTGKKNNTPYAQLAHSIENGTFFKHKLLHNLLPTLSKNDKRVHIIISISANVSQQHTEYILALVHSALLYNIKEILIHILLTDSTHFDMSTFTTLEKLTNLLSINDVIKLASIQGKFYTHCYASDTSALEQLYKNLTHPSTVKFSSWKEVLSYYYLQGLEDSTLPPTLLYEKGYIHPHEGIIFVNYTPTDGYDLKEYIVKKKFPAQAIFSLFEYTSPSSTLFCKKILKDTFTEYKKKFSISSSLFIDYFHKNNLFLYAYDNFKDFSYPLPIKSIISSTHSVDSTTIITQACLDSLYHTNNDLYIIDYNKAAVYGASEDLTHAIAEIETIDNNIKQLYKEFVEKRAGKLFITSSYPLLENISSHENKTTFYKNPNPVIFISVDQPRTIESELTLNEISDIMPFILKKITASLTKNSDGTKLAQDHR